MSEPTLTYTLEQLNRMLDSVRLSCYEAARGTTHLNDPSFTRSQMYWKGRADAANDVRALCSKKEEINANRT